jgi:hypothetical protein
MDSGLAAFAAIRKTPATYNPGSGERRLLVRGHAFQRDVLESRFQTVRDNCLRVARL